MEDMVEWIAQRINNILAPETECAVLSNRKSIDKSIPNDEKHFENL